MRGSTFSCFDARGGTHNAFDPDAVDALRQRAKEWAKRLSVTPRAIRLQNMNRKWGSCSKKGIVTLAIDLAARDRRLQDLVIVHELIHLRVRSHGKLFTTVMTAYLPQWRTTWNELGNLDAGGGPAR